VAKKRTITVNRAPVLTLWAAVVAERLGFDADAALTLGKAVAGLNAQSKGRALGIFKPPVLEPGKKPKKTGLGEDLWIELCGRAVPAKNTDDGVRAVVKDKPIDPEQVRTYLGRAFGDDLAAVQKALKTLAKSFKPDQLAERAFGLYEKFRPAVPRGTKGWGHKGALDLQLIDALRSKARSC
jgi:hypothetical protein